MKLNLKEKYLIVLVVFCFITVGFYYSYAIFVTKQLQENIVSVKIDNKVVTLKVDDKDNIVSIKANSTKELEISLHNTKEINYYYLVLVRGLKAGVKVSSPDEINGEINPLSNKKIMVHVNNTTDIDIELEFAVKVNIEDNLDKDIGYNYINTIDNFDHSKANKPEFGHYKLLPVSYKMTTETDGYWYLADQSNQTSLWYSYENAIWANAVLLSPSDYNKYKNMKIGTEIEPGDILGFYVWIPRFKYYIINGNNWTNYERMTHIVFEEGNKSTGTVNCIDKISNISDTHIYSEVCEDDVYNHIYDNLSSYTHPAFKDKNGLWVGKFFMGDKEKTLPNVSILKKSITDAINISNKHNSHVMTNMEYGAILLLANSLYGKTANPMYNSDDMTFTRIYSNTYEYDVTGCSSEYTNRTKSIIIDKTLNCISYNDLTDYSHVTNSIKYSIGYRGAGASSTGTIYGVYDLASISGEIVSAFVHPLEQTFTINSSYYDSYSYNDYIGKVSSSSSIYNLYRYKLGDGIREHFRNFGEHGMWHNGILMQNKNTGIIVRGNSSSVYSATIEDITYIAPFRIVLN